MKTFICDRQTDLKTFTDETYPQGSFCLARLLKQGDVKVNGVRTHKNLCINCGDEIAYYTTPAQESKPSHALVYEDDSVLIADKQDGVSSEALFCELAQIAPYPVHRLDRNTKGLIILAKTKAAQNILLQAFKGRAVEKVYVCLAKDNFKIAKATLTAYIEKEEKGGVSVYDTPAKGRLTAVTEYEVLESFQGIARVKVTLHTGRTHQIRACLAHIGCPVLGDTRYGDFALNKRMGRTRQCLISKRLAFPADFPLTPLAGNSFESKEDFELTHN